MDLGHGLGHLTYSTLVHPSDDWPQLWASIQRYLPAVKARISPHAPFGVCLRLSAPTAAELAARPDARATLKAFLQDQDLYVYTANAFVYGVFKHTQIKEQVYEPDWRTAARREYTKQVADLLADLCPAWATPSIQTAPLGFKPRVTGPAIVAAFTENVLQVCAHLVHLEQTTGTLLTLGLEPEPRCYLETTDETIAYFQQHLYTGPAAARLSQLAHIPLDTAIGALRRHLGVVFDIGHQAVGFEDIPASLQKLVDAGIPIVKLQEAAALAIGEVTDAKIHALQRFATTIYLSQTVECRGDHLAHYLNLEDAFAGWATDKTPRQWRTHFHVPVFLQDLGPCQSTQFALEQALAMHKATPCPASSKSKPTPGTSSPTTSKPATSSTTSAASSNGSRAGSSKGSKVQKFKGSRVLRASEPWNRTSRTFELLNS